MKQTETYYYAKIGNMYVAFVREETGFIGLSEFQETQTELDEREMKYVSSKFKNAEIKKVTVTTEEEVVKG